MSTVDFITLRQHAARVGAGHKPSQFWTFADHEAILQSVFGLEYAGEAKPDQIDCYLDVLDLDAHAKGELAAHLSEPEGAA